MSTTISEKKSRPLRAHIPCPCGKSSDAYTIFDDGHGYCYSGNCKSPYFAVGDTDNVEGEAPITTTVPIIEDSGRYTYEYLPLRGISREVMQAFGCITKVNEAGVPTEVGFPYGNDAWKIRRLDKKAFYSKGDMSHATLFGKTRYSAGSARSITITEGELDALSVAEILGAGYPVVSVRSSSSAAADCIAERNYLNSFEKIYLCLDNDEAGAKATREVAQLFDFNKVYHVKMSRFKDANEYLTNGEGKTFKNIWWNSRRFLPEEVISSQAEFDSIIENARMKEGTPWPFGQLQSMTYGIRTGETVLLTAMEGIGKTEIVRAVEYHLLKTTEDNIGIIHLEESKARLLQGLAGYELKTPVHLPESSVSDEEVKRAIATITKRDDRLHLYSHFGSSDPDVILDVIRFLVASCRCKYIVLDHITMVVSGLSDEDERKVLDYISTRLAMMVEELDFALIFISHVNDEGRTRGSRNISKIADLWVHLDRDQHAATERERNTTHLTVRKNRFAGRTGPAGQLAFDLSTFTIADAATVIDLPPAEV